MSQNRSLIILSIVALLFLVLTYSNHFDNGFYFDDFHTIKSNVYVRDIRNLPLFFTNPETASILPYGRSYRPVVVSANAIDYWLAGNKYDSHWYHYDIFLNYILQLVLMFFFYRKIFDISNPHRWNKYIAFIATAYYGFHTANAETVNYIICRSDSLSTFFIIAAFVVYQNEKLRKYYLYLIPLAIGLFTKQPAAMFPPLLFLYIFLFEEKGTWKDVFADRNGATWISTLKKTAPAWIVTISLFAFNIYMTPMSPINKGASKIYYLFSQFPVMVYYISNFFFPVGLTAEPDFKIVNDLLDPNVMGSLMVILFTIGIALYYFKNLKYRPITFGILWFYLALVPTSTIAPRYQVANDHRVFFPNIGLVLAVTCILSIWAINNEKKIVRTPQLRTGIPLLIGLIISLYAFGTYQRNEVWGSNEKLWEDALVKSPKNGRVQLNNAITQLGKKNYDSTFYFLNKTKELGTSNSEELELLYARVKQQKGGYSDEEIEQHYKEAVRMGPKSPSSHSNYASWLYKKGRIDEAMKIAQKGHEASPAHVQTNELLRKLKKATENGLQQRIKELQDSIKIDPSNMNVYIDLANVFYGIGNSDEVIKIANDALKIDATSAQIYTQLCMGYNKKGEWDKGIEAGLKAIEIEPKYQKARNNLKVSIKGKANVLGKKPQALADELGIKVKFSKPKNNESKKDSN